VLSSSSVLLRAWGGVSVVMQRQSDTAQQPVHLPNFRANLLRPQRQWGHVSDSSSNNNNKSNHNNSNDYDDEDNHYYCFNGVG
jgi:hypothetical protein